ncbi:hypothetical protein ACS5NO_32060 [Larkinella sp. GY13]|uniref:hypothetical protein n=1 Tax=Larkinella sp. GY13 TaxID=3453720 RepID=UPI003EED554D
MEPQEDPSLEPLKYWAEEVIYEHYQETNPELVAAIRSMIAIGHPPAQIEDWAKGHIPDTSQVATHIFMIANLLHRSHFSRN